MTLQFTVNLKQHPTVTTIIRSTVAVHTTFMLLQVAGTTETLVTQWTLVRFSPVWTLMWVFRSPNRLNALSHTWHLYGFCPPWILLWFTRWPDCVNRLPQTVHSNGFSPEWLRMCTARALLLGQHLPQPVHLYSPLWIFIWLSRVHGYEKRFSHWVHWNGFSPVCIRSWIFKLCLCAKRLWQKVHQYGLGLSACRPSVVPMLLASTFISHAWDLSIPSPSVSSVLLFPVCSQHNKCISCESQQNHNHPATS